MTVLIRGSVSAPPQTLCCEARDVPPSLATLFRLILSDGNNNRVCDEQHNRRDKSDRVGDQDFICQPVNHLAVSSQPFAMSGQLESANALIFYSRALSRCVDVLKHHPSEATHRLPVIVTLACCPRRHENIYDTGNFHSAAKN